jgi:hypothetical protein
MRTDVTQRIEELKRRRPPDTENPLRFEYDEDQPPQLLPRNSEQIVGT